MLSGYFFATFDSIIDLERYHLKATQFRSSLIMKIFTRITLLLLIYVSIVIALNILVMAKLKNFLSVNTLEMGSNAERNDERAQNDLIIIKINKEGKQNNKCRF